MDIYRKQFKGKNDNLYFMEQLSEVDNDMPNATTEEKNAKKIEIIRHMAEIINKAYPELIKDKNVSYKTEKEADSINVMYEVSDDKGHKALLKAAIKRYNPFIDDTSKMKPEMVNILVNEKEKVNAKFAKPLSDVEQLDPTYIEKHKEELTEGYNAVADWVAKATWYDDFYYDKDTKADAFNKKGEYSGFAYTLYKLNDQGEYVELSEDEQSKFTNPISEYKFNGIKKVFKEEYIWTASKNVQSDVDIVKELKEANFDTLEDAYHAQGQIPVIAKAYLEALKLAIEDSETGNTLPREALERVIGKPIKVTGLKLQRDTIPAIDRAIFAQYKTKVNSKLGLQLWFLHSINDKNHDFRAGRAETKEVTRRIFKGNKKDSWGYDTYPITPIYEDATFKENVLSNDVYKSNKLANVFSIGLQYQLGNSALLSVDYGQNRTNFGRYMNGHTNYEHTPGTADFKLKGHSMGGTPHFWTARLDIGQSDYTRPGSWNAFMDYKYFAHGSFFGGNGTGAVPDRYLDGIRSFTLGGGYVPRKDFLVEAFYTFDAKGIGQRDTLYGGENFKLGNYTRIQGTYKF